jgi:FMN phosphatase YigB (HAD superfamily)
MKLLLVDLDDTLIDTSNFKKILFKSLTEKTGLPVGLIKTKYESLKINHQLGIGWPEKLSSDLSEISKVSKSILIGIIYECTNSLRGNIRLLDFLKSSPHVKYILTSGDKKFQKKKIDNLGLGKYIDGVIYCFNDKEKKVKSFINKTGMLINGVYFDNVEIIDDKDYLLKGLLKYRWIKVTHPKKII